MNCNKCGYVLPDIAKFCRSCGEAQINVTEILKKQTQISESNPTQSSVNSSYDYLTLDKAALINNQSAPIKKHRKKRKIFLIVVLIILSIFVLAFLSNNTKNNSLNIEQKQSNIVQKKSENEKQNLPVLKDQEINQKQNDANNSDESIKSNDSSDKTVNEEPKKTE